MRFARSWPRRWGSLSSWVIFPWGVFGYHRLQPNQFDFAGFDLQRQSIGAVRDHVCRAPSASLTFLNPQTCETALGLDFPSGGSLCSTWQPPRFCARFSMKSVKASRTARPGHVPTSRRKSLRLRREARYLPRVSNRLVATPSRMRRRCGADRGDRRELPGYRSEDFGSLSGRFRRDGGPQEGYGHPGDEWPRLGGPDQAPRGQGARPRHLLTRTGRTNKRRMEDHVQRTGDARVDGGAANGVAKGRGASSCGHECDLAGACSSAAAACRSCQAAARKT